MISCTIFEIICQNCIWIVQVRQVHSVVQRFSIFIRRLKNSVFPFLHGDFRLLHFEQSFEKNAKFESRVRGLVKSNQNRNFNRLFSWLHSLTQSLTTFHSKSTHNCLCIVNDHLNLFTFTFPTHLIIICVNGIPISNIYSWHRNRKTLGNV